MSEVEKVRAAVRSMRDEIADWDPDTHETKFFAETIRLIEMAADDAAGVEAMNARTAERAERIGGDGHTWVMHRPEWPIAIAAADAYLAGSEVNS